MRKINHNKVFCYIVVGIFAVFFACMMIYMFTGKTKNKVNNFCYDYNEIFSDEQVSAINDECLNIYKKKKIAIIVATTGREDRKAMLNGIEFCEREKIDATDNFVVIIINGKVNENGEIIGDGSHFDIYTYGNSAWKISDNEIKKLVYSDAADEILSSNQTEIFNGTLSLVKLSQKAYSGILPNNVSWTVIMVIAGIIGLVVSLIITIGVKKSYTRKRENKNYSISSNTNLNLIGKQDRYIRSTTTSVVVRSDSGKSGGFSGGGGFSIGGGGGGGGGGHRGGR